MFSRLPGKVSRCDVDIVKCTQKVSLQAGKFCSYETKNISITEISHMTKQDLATREYFSSHMNAMQLFILFHNKARSRLQTCRNVFSVNRDNFCPQQQALIQKTENAAQINFG